MVDRQFSSSRLLNAISDVAGAVQGIGKSVDADLVVLRRQLTGKGIDTLAIDRIKNTIQSLVAIDVSRLHFGNDGGPGGSSPGGSSPGGSSPGGSSPGGSSPGGSSPGGSSPGGSSPGGSSPGGSSPGGSSPGGSSPGGFSNKIFDAFLDIAAAVQQVQFVASRLQAAIAGMQRSTALAVQEVRSLAVVDRSQLSNLGGAGGLSATSPRDARQGRMLAPQAPPQRGRS